MVRLHRENRSVFYRVRCPDCNNEQLVFQKASTRVDCIVCGHVLAEPQGGNAVIKGEILESLK
ncbi:MAG: 30S ribosomal protein S27e [Methanoculleaceae archaeon]